MYLHAGHEFLLTQNFLLDGSITEVEECF